LKLVIDKRTVKGRPLRPPPEKSVTRPRQHRAEKILALRRSFCRE